MWTAAQPTPKHRFYCDSVSHFLHSAPHLQVWEVSYCSESGKSSCGEIIQPWQASKESLVCGIFCIVSEFPLQAGSNKLITLRSKWLTSCSLPWSICILKGEGKKSHKTKRPSFCYLKPVIYDLCENSVCEEMGKGMDSWLSPHNLDSGMIYFLKFSKHFQESLRDHLAPISCTGFCVH